MNKFFFLDLETTGLNEQECTILEVAAIITDNKLNPIDEYRCSIYTSAEELSKMDAWCKTTHTQSGLIEEVIQSHSTIQLVERDLQVLKRKHFPVNKPPLSGSSVHFDKRFIDKLMPHFSKELSHRIIDVSSFMGALDNYYGFKLPSQPEATHRALADIKQSISYLKQYLEGFVR